MHENLGLPVLLEDTADVVQSKSAKKLHSKEEEFLEEDLKENQTLVKISVPESRTAKLVKVFLGDTRRPQRAPENSNTFLALKSARALTQPTQRSTPPRHKAGSTRGSSAQQVRYEEGVPTVEVSPLKLGLS